MRQHLVPSVVFRLHNKFQLSIDGGDADSEKKNIKKKEIGWKEHIRNDNYCSLLLEQQREGIIQTKKKKTVSK